MASSMNIVSLLILISSFIILDVVHGFSAANYGIDSDFLSQKIDSNRTIIVDLNGEGDFKSIQAAIDSVPEGNSEWVTIHVNKGIYR